MAVASWGRLAGKEGSFGPIAEWTAKREWLFKTNNRYDEENVVLAYGYGNNILPFPLVSSLPSNPLLLCRRVLPKQDKKSPLHWVVTAEYSTEYLSKQEKDAQQYQNPVDRPSSIKWNTAKYNKPVVYDTGNNLILNSAGDPFDPPPEKDASRWTATVTKNVPAVPSYILDYCDAVNSEQFTIQGLPVAQYVAKIMSIEIGEEQAAQISEFQEQTYFTFTYTLEFRSAQVTRNSGVKEPEGWLLRLLDQGFREKDPNDSTKRRHIKDDASPAKFVTHPWPLDGTGKKLADPKVSTAKQRNFDVYNYISFSNLPGINGNP